MNAAVIIFPGSNCDRDVMRALRQTGARVHEVWHKETHLPAADLVVLPGGFSFGDYLRCGAIAKFSPIMAAVRRFAEAGGLMLGICNGFQILTEMGLLPGALVANKGLKFVCKTVHLRVENTRLAHTSRYQAGQIIALPVAHGEGNFTAAPDVLEALEKSGRAVFRYCDEQGEATAAANPNGAARNIAGITNEAGNVLGLMPHPERRVEAALGGTGGLLLFEGLASAAQAHGRAEVQSAREEVPVRFPGDKAADAALAADHGVNGEEYRRICEILGRTPSYLELGMFSVMWSEHCSYKSSRVHLKNLPVAGPHVLQGPGENAGVIDAGDGLALAFKIESHNHPSYIEPYQGAATGVGGILRDVFTMGARPIANLNSLRFGDPAHPRTPYLVERVVAGIGDYGNCMGIPTVGGEVFFDDSYDGNCLVNAFTIGVLPADRIFRGIASGSGNPVMYVGSKTGRDGIHGATMASAEFGEGAEEKRPTVQVGDPFTEKLLLEACLELMARDLIVGIQDMGAAGLTSSSCEMAGRGGAGIDLDLDAVPMREAGMTPYEIMLSESQERMLLIAKEGAEAQVAAIFAKWDLDAAVIGRVTETGRVRVFQGGKLAANIPAAALTDEAPRYERPIAAPAGFRRGGTFNEASVPEPQDYAAVIERMVAAPNLASKRWVFEQYDHEVQTGTVRGPGGDAAVVRLPGTAKGVALSVDCNSRYCQLDPYWGAQIAVAEAARNVSCTGARPLGVTNCLNFGNPEKPEIMWQFAEAVRGLGDACRVLATPVVSGNVSLYNETGGRAVFPTPTIVMVGLLDHATAAMGSGFREAGDVIALVGPPGSGLGGSEYLRVIHGRCEGPLPALDFTAELAVQRAVRELCGRGLIHSAHDVSDGGLAMTLLESAFAAPKPLGFRVTDPAVPRLDVWLFGESQSRVVVSFPRQLLGKIQALCEGHQVPLAIIGEVAADGTAGFGAVQLPLARLGHLWSTGFAQALGFAETPV